MLETFTSFARYNMWANALLYDAVADLSQEDFNRDCGVFFKSMCGTLNHLVIADQVWLNRFTGEGPMPKELDGIVTDAFVPLREIRETLDKRMVDWTLSLTDAEVDGMFTYTPITDPTPVTQKLAPAVTHIFNHQTHHRGQAHAILTRLTGDAPALDHIYFQRDERLANA